jgi:predicted kinase
MRAKVEQLQWQLTKRLLELRQVVIIEWGTWGRDERDSLREGARAQGAAVELRYLDASVDLVWERIRDRDMEFRLGGRRLSRADIESYSAAFERPDADELAVYDNPITPP